MKESIYIAKEDKREETVIIKISSVEERKRECHLFPYKMKIFWKQVVEHLDEISEIRLGAGKYTRIYIRGGERYLDEDGNIKNNVKGCRKASYEDLQELMDHWCKSSRYAFRNEICNGFLTVEGGHRIGLCGEVVLDDKNEIINIKYISSINIRIAHEKIGISDPVLPFLYKKGTICNTLIISPPGAGKTTLLRDLIRNISQGNEIAEGKNVTVIDERREISASFQGTSQMKLGMRTDVLDGCPKALGMRMALRSMSPSVIAVDELGDKNEYQLIREMQKCGCSIVASLHAASVKEAKEKWNSKDIRMEEIFSIFIELYKEKGEYHLNIYRGKEEQPCYIS